jgi:hypothetical protein
MIKYFKLNLIFLFAFGSLYAAPIKSDNTSFKELSRKTIRGFVVPYFLRYDSDKWYESKSELLWRGGYGIIIKIYESKKKLAHDQEDAEFQVSLKKGCANPSLFSDVEFTPSEIVEINGISFLHQKAIINLIPNSRHYRKEGTTEYVRRIGEKGAQDQFDCYVCHAEKGEISLCIDSTHLITPEEQKEIDELLKGFSFDGSAYSGPKKLRALKDAFEFITNQ